MPFGRTGPHEQKGVVMPGSGSFNPEAITALRGVLDEVWAEIQPLTHAGNQQVVREKIGEAVMTIASTIASRDVTQVKVHAMHLHAESS